MKQSINIQGITTTATYQDGDCSDLLNARNRNGAIQPVSPRKVVKELLQEYDTLFVHRNAGYENWIGVRGFEGTDVKEVHYILPNQAGFVPFLATKGKTSITQLGNILNILDNDGFKYVMWRNGDYESINFDFRGGQQLDESDLEQIIDLKVEGIKLQVDNLERAVRMYVKDYSYSSLNNLNSQDNRNIRRNDVVELMHRALAIEARDGRLTGFFLACTAYELWDGSHVLHSRPVLLGQSWDTGTRYTHTLGGTAHSYIDRRVGFLNMTTWNENQMNTDGFLETFVWDNELFVFNDTINENTQTTRNPPNLYASGFHHGSNNFATNTNISSNELKLRLAKRIPAQYKDLIRSIAIFITPQIQQHDLSDVNTTRGFYINTNRPVESYTGRPKTNAEIIKELESQLFYRVASISFDEINSQVNEWITLDLKGKLGENLFMQEQLPVDVSRNTFNPQGQHMYNSRLHAFNYKELLPRSHPVESFIPTGSGDNGQFNAFLHEATTEWWIEAEIRTPEGTSRTVRYKLLNSDIVRDAGHLAPMVSFPDSRARRLRIAKRHSFNNGASFTTRIWNLELKESKNYNFSYFISEDLKPFSVGGALYPPIPEEKNTEIYVKNGIKVSATNNPIVFPPINTYQASGGEVLAMQANVMNVADRNFGQFPLYVATTQGFFMLAVGSGEIAYSRIIPSASRIIPISKTLCSTPYGIAFVGQRGVFILNGNDTVCITLPIEEEPELGEGFLKHIQGLDNILYNPTESELLIVNKNYSYCLVFNFDTRMFYRSTEKIDVEVQNTEPRLLVAEGRKIKDYSLSEKPQTNVSIITRPILFGVEEIKKMQRVIMRGRIFNLKTDKTPSPSGLPLKGEELQPFLGLYGSNDGVNFILLRGMTMPSDKQGRDYKDFDLGMMAKATYRSYIIKLTAEIDENTRIEPIEFIVEINNSSDKMR